MSTQGIFITSQDKNSPSAIPINLEWINTLWYIYTMEGYTTVTQDNVDETRRKGVQTVRFY